MKQCLNRKLDCLFHHVSHILSSGHNRAAHYFFDDCSNLCQVIHWFNVFIKIESVWQPRPNTTFTNRICWKVIEAWNKTKCTTFWTSNGKPLEVAKIFTYFTCPAPAKFFIIAFITADTANFNGPFLIASRPLNPFAFPNSLRERPEYQKQPFHFNLIQASNHKEHHSCQWFNDFFQTFVCSSGLQRSKQNTIHIHFKLCASLIPRLSTWRRLTIA